MTVNSEIVNNSVSTTLAAAVLAMSSSADDDVRALENCTLNGKRAWSDEYDVFNLIVNGYMTVLCVLLGTIGNGVCVRYVRQRMALKSSVYGRNGTSLGVALTSLAFWDTALLWCAFGYYGIKNLGPVAQITNDSTSIVLRLTPSFHALSQIANTASIWSVVTITVQRYLATRNTFTQFRFIKWLLHMASAEITNQNRLVFSSSHTHQQHQLQQQYLNSKQQNSCARGKSKDKTDTDDSFSAENRRRSSNRGRISTKGMKCYRCFFCCFRTTPTASTSAPVVVTDKSGFEALTNEETNKRRRIWNFALNKRHRNERNSALVVDVDDDDDEYGDQHGPSSSSLSSTTARKRLRAHRRHPFCSLFEHNFLSRGFCGDKEEIELSEKIPSSSYAHIPHNIREHFSHPQRRRRQPRHYLDYFRLPLALSVLAVLVNIPAFFELVAVPCVMPTDWQTTGYKLKISKLRMDPLYKLFYKVIFRMLVTSCGPNILILCLTILTVLILRKANRARKQLLKMNESELEKYSAKAKMLTTISIMLVTKFLLFRSLSFILDIWEVTFGLRQKVQKYLYLVDVSNFLILLNSATNCVIISRGSRWIQKQISLRYTLRKERRVFIKNLNTKRKVMLIDESWHQANQLLSGEVGSRILHAMLAKSPRLIDHLRSGGNEIRDKNASTFEEKRRKCNNAVYNQNQCLSQRQSDWAHKIGVTENHKNPDNDIAQTNEHFDVPHQNIVAVSSTKNVRNISSNCCCDVAATHQQTGGQQQQLPLLLLSSPSVSATDAVVASTSFCDETDCDAAASTTNASLTSKPVAENKMEPTHNQSLRGSGGGDECGGGLFFGKDTLRQFLHVPTLLSFSSTGERRRRKAVSTGDIPHDDIVGGVRGGKSDNTRQHNRITKRNNKKQRRRATTSSASASTRSPAAADDRRRSAEDRASSAKLELLRLLNTAIVPSTTGLQHRLKLSLGNTINKNANTFDAETVVRSTSAASHQGLLPLQVAAVERIAGGSLQFGSSGSASPQTPPLMIAEWKLAEVAARIQAFLDELIQAWKSSENEEQITARVRKIGQIHSKLGITIQAPAWKELIGIGSRFKFQTYFRFKQTVMTIISECEFISEEDRNETLDAWNWFVSLLIRDFRNGMLCGEHSSPDNHRRNTHVFSSPTDEQRVKNAWQTIKNDKLKSETC